MKTDKENKEIVLAEHPWGLPNKETFRFNDIVMPHVKEEGVLLKSLYVSVDPKLPDAFIGLFTGENIGKQMVKIGDANRQ